MIVRCVRASPFLVAAVLSLVTVGFEFVKAAPVMESTKSGEGFEFVPGTVIPLDEPDRLRLNAAREIFARQFSDLRARIGDDKPLMDALSHLEQGKFENALTSVDAYLESNADKAEAYEIRGVALTYLSKPKDGIKALEDSARLAPGVAAPLTKIGDIYVAMNQMDDARAAYKRAVEADASNRRAQARYGIALEAGHDYAAAIPHLVDSLKGVSPSEASPAKIALGRALVLIGSPDMAVTVLEPLVNQRTAGSTAAVILGNAYLADGAYDAAVKTLSAARNVRDKDPGVAYALGRAYAFLGKRNEALEALSAAAANAPQPAIVNREIASVHLAAGENTEAETILRRLAASDQARASDLRFIGDIEVSRGDLAAAEKTFSKMVKQFPDDPASYQKLGSLRAAMTRYKDAESTLESGLKRLGPQADILHTLIIVRLRLNDLAGAREAADSLIEVAGDSAGARTLAGSVYEQAGQTQTAATYYREAIKIDSQNLVALNNLASVLSADGDFEHAVDYASRAHTIDPDNAVIAHNLGWISFNLGRLDAAKALLEEAESKDADNARLAYRLGRVYQALGDAALARTQYDKALSASEDFDGADDARIRRDMLSEE